MTFVIAHRGASRVWPENTIDAFRGARDAGADAVEFDVRPSADGHLVIHHDAVLADGRPVTAVRRAELSSKIPNLSEALAACDGMWVNVEIKADVFDGSGWVGDEEIARFVDAVVAAVEAAGVTERVLFSSFAVEVLDRCRLTGGAGVRTAHLCDVVSDEIVETCVRRADEAVHPFVGSVQRVDVDRCHEHALAVNTWTCNDADRMDELIGWGVDGIFTDVPDVLVARLAGRTAPD